MKFPDNLLAQQMANHGTLDASDGLLLIGVVSHLPPFAPAVYSELAEFPLMGSNFQTKGTDLASQHSSPDFTPELLLFEDYQVVLKLEQNDSLHFGFEPAAQALQLLAEIINEVFLLFVKVVSTDIEEGVHIESPLGVLRLEFLHNQPRQVLSLEEILQETDFVFAHLHRHILVAVLDGLVKEQMSSAILLVKWFF